MYLDKSIPSVAGSLSGMVCGRIVTTETFGTEDNSYTRVERVRQGRGQVIYNLWPSFVTRKVN